MFKKSLIFSLTVFFTLMIITSLIKNKTRNLEKKIEKINKEVAFLEKELSDAEIDYIYLSSPEKLKQYLSTLGKEEYLSFDHSRIFFSTEQFLKHSLKEIGRASCRERV